MRRRRRDQSIWSPRASQSSTANWTDLTRPSLATRAAGAGKSSQTRPSSCGSICQGILLRRTKTMAMRHARSETRGRPPCGPREGIGANGSTRSHNGSGSSAAAMLVHVTSPTTIKFLRFVTRSYCLRFLISSSMNCRKAGFVSPNSVASSSARSTSQPSTSARFMSHIPAALPPPAQ
jgi:hypothetical protein